MRLDFVEPHAGRDDAGRGGLPAARRLYVPASLSHLPSLMDGTLTLRDLAADLTRRHPELSAAEAFREVAKVGFRLACMGAVDEATVAS